MCSKQEINKGILRFEAENESLGLCQVIIYIKHDLSQLNTEILAQFSIQLS